MDQNGVPWFETSFSPEELAGTPGPRFPGEIRARLLYILQTARQLQPGFLSGPVLLEAVTRLEFPREWGLGTSSTLISNLADWAGADPYALLDKTIGGSGYDLACGIQCALLNLCWQQGY